MSVKPVNVGRNDRCPCGSGKKYKKCHGDSTNLLNEAAKSSAAPDAPFSIQKLTPLQSMTPFIVQRTTASRVPFAIIEKAQRQFAEHQRREQERTGRLGQVRPEISGDLQGYKFVAIGSRLMYMPSDRCKFFTDVLIAYVPQLFGREWFEQEVAKPLDARHPVMKWRVKGMNFMNAQPQLPDGTYGATPTGPLLAYLTFAYDLYIVEHNARLDARLLERLKHADQFQGARHELFAEATCLRAGFEIKHENETDGSTRHVEFVATHKASGQQISVEAKSKHRPGVLGQPGTRQADNAVDLPFGRLLNDAIAKEPPHPLAVFLDMNMPFSTAQRFLAPPPHRFILRTIDRIQKQHGGKCPINLLVITNHPQHYTKGEEIAQSQHLLSLLSRVPEKPTPRPDAFTALHQAANLYGNIPQELSTNFGQT
jgi:hypothetical protein